MDETLDAALLSLLWADDDYAQVELRAKDGLARHGTELVLALADLATKLAETAADAENKLRALAGELEPEISARDVIHAVVADGLNVPATLDIGGEG
jgi:hypothetical protein